MVFTISDSMSSWVPIKHGRTNTTSAGLLTKSRELTGGNRVMPLGPIHGVIVVQSL